MDEQAYRSIDSNAQTLEASDGHLIFLRQWQPQHPPRAVIHIAHGMSEHSERYSHLAHALTNHGWIVYAHDHRGHGYSAPSEAMQGHFGDDVGWNAVIDDTYQVNQYLNKQHSNIPTILLGHSMGSFVTQSYIIQHGHTLAGAILLGSNGRVSPLLLGFGQIAARLERWRQGPKGKSALLHLIAFGGYNLGLKPRRTPFDWLSRDERAVKKYIEDPLCGFLCSNQFWLDLLEGLKFNQEQENLKKIPKELPILILGGSADPVGGHSKGLERLYNAYHSAGIARLQKKIYLDARHELVNEINQDEVFHDIVTWIKTIVG